MFHLERTVCMQHKSNESIDRIISFVNDFYRDNNRSPSIRQLASGTGLGVATVHRYLKTMTERGLIDYDGEIIVTEQSNKIRNEVFQVGVVGSVPCGPLSLEEEFIEEYVNLPTAIFGGGDLFLLRASGDSMSGVGIEDGDLVLIRRQEEAHDGDIVVAYVEGEGNTLKRYKKYGNTVFLHPENPKYVDIPVKDCKIQGVAVWGLKKFN